MIRGRRQPESRASFDVQSMRGMVHDRKELVRLQLSRRKPADRSEIAVLLGREDPRIARDVREARRRREIQISQPAVRRIENWIQHDVHRPKMPAEDRPDLRSESGSIPVPGVPAELEICAVEESAVVGVRHGEERAQLCAIEKQPAAGAVPRKAVEREIESRLKPLRDAVRPLRNAVEGLIGDDRSRKGGRLDPARSVVVMQRQVEFSRLGEFALIDLDLIGLCRRATGRSKRSDDQKRKSGTRGRDYRYSTFSQDPYIGLGSRKYFVPNGLYAESGALRRL
jgi:hypothetical protein